MINDDKAKMIRDNMGGAFCKFIIMAWLNRRKNNRCEAVGKKRLYPL